MRWRWVFLLYTLIISISAILFDNQATQTPVLLLAALLYTTIHFARKNTTLLRYVQYGLLFLIHGLSATDWCLPLYVAHMTFSLAKDRQLVAVLNFCLLTAAFSGIAFTYRVFEPTEISNVLYMVLSCIVLAYFFRKYHIQVEKQTIALNNEKQHLITHDALTGLYNYEELHRQLEQYVQDSRPISLTLLDCKDLKSLNTTNGFQGVNTLLKQASQLLRIMFPDALLIARYGGDEFAIVLESTDTERMANSTKQMLASEFPKLTGIDINYGMAFFPYDGTTKDDLIFTAEKALYHMKRDSWLKREEHMLRSEKLRVVGELASGMAHEIRNPLTTVKGFIQLSKANSYSIEPWYELIMDEIDRMSMLTVEFLQFSKPHAVKYKPHSIQLCIERVISLLDSESTRLGHQIRFDAPEKPVLMLMDQDKMLQLLLNLVKNAFEAMPEQGLVKIRLSRHLHQAVLEITDTGKGIPKDELEKVFLPFYTTKESGTGLGLSICHKIVQDHNGSIEVESIPEKGTKFIISVPALPEDASVTPPTEAIGV
jgi:diguanylate cyclase (GGDEF)-like protein